MMKKALVSVFLGFVFCSLIFVVGCCCCGQPGETKAEVNRRHVRAYSINHQEMKQDIDRVLLLDEPTKLTDKKVR